MLMLLRLDDRKLFGNDAGEDEELDVLNSYYIDNRNFEDFFDSSEKLFIVSARKGMGKSALLSRLEYRLKNELYYGNPLVVRVKGNELLGLGDFQGDSHSYLENYWKQIICKRIIIEIGKGVGFAVSSDEISMVELAEIDGIKNKNVLGALVSRISGKLPLLGVEVKKSIPENAVSLLAGYQQRNLNSDVWILVDDIDAKYQNTSAGQALVGAFFSAIRSLAFDMEGLRIRSTVRSDVWSCLRHLEDLDKIEQYILNLFWSKKDMRDILAQRVLAYVKARFPESDEAKYILGRDYNKILDLAFLSPIEWGQNKDARLFDAISAFSNRRPRWMGQLARMAGKKARDTHNFQKISLNHIEFILSEFGANRRDDLMKEHLHQFDELLNLIDALRTMKREFSSEELHAVIAVNFIRGRELVDIPEVDGKPYRDVADLGDFLFKLGLISRIHPDGKNFTHFTDDPDLYGSIENRAGRVIWSIHPAYRKFLNIW